MTENEYLLLLISKVQKKNNELEHNNVGRGCG